MTNVDLTLLGWKPLRKNTLRGFAHVKVGAVLAIKDVAVHANNGKTWVSLPARAAIDPDGRVMKNDHGRVVYFPVIEWTSPVVARFFAEGLIEMLEARHPGVLAS